MKRREFIGWGMMAAGSVLARPVFAAAPNARLPAIGAEILWETYLAQSMKRRGTLLGPQYVPFQIEMESSGQACVKLASPGDYVEFTLRSPANAMVIRYSLPDSPEGDGIDAGLELYRNGDLVRTIPITSRYSWLYGKYPFTNDPKAGKPRNFYDECRVKGLNLVPGDVIRLQKPADAGAYCIIDLVDLETAAPPISQPAGALSLLDFGAGGRGETDDTEALRTCLAAAAKQNGTVWAPAGDYRLTGEIVIPSNVTLQGAGMWHSSFIGDPGLYSNPGRRVKFVLKGQNSHLADFAIVGKLTHRDDKEGNDGVIGEQARDFTVHRLWIEHTKVGMWFYGCSNGLVEGCRIRNTRADGINICTHSSDVVARNCTARNTGDDCFAIWPAAFDHEHAPHGATPGSNVIENCTGELSYLANGGALYGGAGNRIERCRFSDIAAGCGILISTTFPTADEAYGIDYNFSGTTVVLDCELVRCGGFDHEWGWRASFQICLDRRPISGLAVSKVTVRDSLSDGLGIVAKNQQSLLSDARFDHITIPNCGIAVPDRHGLSVRQEAGGSLTLHHSTIADIRNDSSRFSLIEG